MKKNESVRQDQSISKDLVLIFFFYGNKVNKIKRKEKDIASKKLCVISFLKSCRTEIAQEKSCLKTFLHTLSWKSPSS